MKDNTKKCRFCGKEIGIITYGIYRKCVVDAEAVTVVASPDGDEYIRVDGTKLKARRSRTTQKRKARNRPTGRTGGAAEAENEVRGMRERETVRGRRRVLRPVRNHHQQEPRMHKKRSATA